MVISIFSILSMTLSDETRFSVFEDIVFKTTYEHIKDGGDGE